MKEYKVDPHNYSGPLEQLEKKTPTSNNKGTKIAVFIALITLAMGGFVFYTLYDGNGPSEIDTDSLFPLIPVWVAIFVPFIAIKNQKKKQISKKMSSDLKRTMIFLVAGTALLIILAFGVLIFTTTI